MIMSNYGRNKFCSGFSVYIQHCQTHFISIIRRIDAKTELSNSIRVCLYGDTCQSSSTAQ